MKAKKLLFLLIAACIPSVWVAAGNYVAFSETFGNPTSPISRTTDNNSDVYSLTGNITSGTYVILNGRQGGKSSSILLDNTVTVWPNTGPAGDAATGGVITSTSIFGATTPILGVGGEGGFAAYTLQGNISRSGSPWTFMRVFIDGSRFVVGEDYTFSFQFASGANDNWVWAGGNTTPTDVMVRGLIYTNVGAVGTPADNWNDIIVVTGGSNTSYYNGNSDPNAGSWQPYTVTSGSGTPGSAGTVGIGVGANVVCDVRGYLNTGSVLLVDDLQVVGPQPELTSDVPSVSISGATATDASLSDAIAIACNAAGTYGIHASISGPGAAFFSVTDENGDPLTDNTLALPGGNIKIKFAPDASVTTDQTATLTLSASPDSYGAAPIEIPLTGIADNTGIINPSVKNAVISDNGNDVTIKVAGQSDVKIFSASGSLITDAVVADSFDYALNAGVYIIKINGVSYKFVKK